MEKKIEKIVREVNSLYKEKPFNFGRLLAQAEIERTGLAVIPSIPEQALIACKTRGWNVKKFRAGWNASLQVIFG